MYCMYLFLSLPFYIPHTAYHIPPPNFFTFYLLTIPLTSTYIHLHTTYASRSPRKKSKQINCGSVPSRHLGYFVKYWLFHTDPCFPAQVRYLHHNLSETYTQRENDTYTNIVNHSIGPPTTVDSCL
ncbi:hypothetical protein M434DRAFT_161615 [Hypoxylon sp. CO27-5]|nr:hypothetical protein M434DRAFT_161615 [Hypoxylon sp. CO27-5]